MVTYTDRMTTFVTNCMVFEIALLLTAHVHVLPFVRASKKINEEEERATLENFVDSSILELLLNETEGEKDINYLCNGHSIACLSLWRSLRFQYSGQN